MGGRGEGRGDEKGMGELVDRGAFRHDFSLRISYFPLVVCLFSAFLP